MSGTHNLLEPVKRAMSQSVNALQAQCMCACNGDAVVVQQQRRLSHCLSQVLPRGSVQLKLSAVNSVIAASSGATNWRVRNDSNQAGAGTTMALRREGCFSSLQGAPVALYLAPLERSDSPALSMSVENPKGPAFGQTPPVRTGHNQILCSTV